MSVVEVENVPRLVLVATKDISAGSELAYDYGDRRKVLKSSLIFLVTYIVDLYII